MVQLLITINVACEAIKERFLSAHDDVSSGNPLEHFTYRSKNLPSALLPSKTVFIKLFSRRYKDLWKLIYDFSNNLNNSWTASSEMLEKYNWRSERIMTFYITHERQNKIFNAFGKRLFLIHYKQLLLYFVCCWGNWHKRWENVCMEFSDNVMETSFSRGE